MSKEKIMELVEHTANHLGIISKGSLEIFANQVRLETIREKIPYNVSEWAEIGKERGYWDYFRQEVIKEVEEMINKEFKHEKLYCEAQDLLHEIKASLNKL